MTRLSLAGKSLVSYCFKNVSRCQMELLDPVPDVGVLSHSSTGRGIKCECLRQLKFPISEKTL